MDTEKPSIPTISYNSGSNECKWENNINMNLSSNDNVGIAYYQGDWNGDGTPDGNLSGNFVPGNGHYSHNNRFRAVDHAGNVSDWSSSVHIHMDTEAPKKTNWWWGEVNTNVARLYIQTSDNASGINRVQCPTSTASGGYNNWVWFNTVWDSSANAWRADITPATFGHYGQTYTTHLYIYDNAGNGGYVDATSINIGSIEPVNLASTLAWTNSNGTSSSYGYSSATAAGASMHARFGTSWSQSVSSYTNLSQFKNIKVNFRFRPGSSGDIGYFRMRVVDSSGTVLQTNQTNSTVVSNAYEYYSGSYTFTPSSNWTNCKIECYVYMTCGGGDGYEIYTWVDSITGNYN